MKKRIVVLFLLISLVCGCAPAAPTTLPTATRPSISSATAAQTSEPSLTSIPATLPAGGLKLEQIAQLGGSINGLVIAGDLAYVGMGPRLAVINIRDHAHPQLVSQSEPLPGLVSELVQVQAGTAPLLLVNAGKFLVLVDVSDPSALKPVHQLELQGAITALVWDEQTGMAYVGWSVPSTPSSTGYTGFISAVGLTPDKDLKLINTVSMPERPLSLALDEGGLFAGSEGYQGGLYHVQVKNPGQLSTPRRVIASTPESPLQPLHMQVIGRTLTLCYRAVEAYDITDPERPVQIWNRNWGGESIIDDFSFAGEQVYIFGWTIKNEYRHDTLPLPGPFEGSALGKRSSDTAMHDGDFLVAFNDLEIYDTADLRELQPVGSWQSPVTYATNVDANDKTAFVLDLGAGDGNSQAILKMLSLPDLEPLGQVITEIPNAVYVYRAPYISLEDDRLYLASLDAVWAYDIGRTQPVLLGEVGIDGGNIDAIMAFRSGGRRLLVIAQEGPDHIKVLKGFDLTDLQKPVELGSPLRLDQGYVLQMVWNGNALYVLLYASYHSQSDTLYWVSFDSNALKLNDSLKLAKATENLAGDETLILLADPSEQARRPTLLTVGTGPLRQISQMPLPESGMGLAVAGDTAFAVVGIYEGPAQLLVVDVRDAANPRQVETVDIAVGDVGHVPIIAVGPYVVLANGWGGVEVFRTGS